MGDLIVLSERLADRSRPAQAGDAAFFFDPTCPFSYLAAERVERVLGEVDWVPTAAVAFRRVARAEPPEPVRAAAERLAAALRLPLVWPEGSQPTLPPPSEPSPTRRRSASAPASR